MSSSVVISCCPAARFVEDMKRCQPGTIVFVGNKVPLRRKIATNLVLLGVKMENTSDNFRRVIKYFPYRYEFDSDRQLVNFVEERIIDPDATIVYSPAGFSTAGKYLVSILGYSPSDTTPDDWQKFLNQPVSQTCCRVVFYGNISRLLEYFVFDEHEMSLREKLAI